MTTQVHYVDTVGTVVTIDVVPINEDISAATVKKMLVKKPSGEEIEWIAAFAPINAFGNISQIQYTVQAGDWDEAGWWSVQSYVEVGGWEGRGATIKFELKANFK